MTTEGRSKSWGNGVVRIYTWAKLRDLKTGVSMEVVNTHWDHQHQGSREQSARAVAAAAAGEGPTLVLGDFNATLANPAIRYLLGDKMELAGGPDGAEKSPAPLRSAFLVANGDVPDRRTFNGWKGTRTGRAMIDHVLVSQQWTVVRSWIELHHKEGMWPSDHFPVAAVLKPAKPE